MADPTLPSPPFPKDTNQTPYISSADTAGNHTVPASNWFYDVASGLWLPVTSSRGLPMVPKKSDGTEILTDAAPGSVKVTGSNFEQAPGSAIPTKAVLMGISDGTNIQAMKGNTEDTLMASAARTATTSSPNQVNYNARGVIVVMNITAVPGVDTVTLAIQGIDPASGNVYVISSDAAIGETGLRQVLVYPGAGAEVSMEKISPVPLPRTWRVAVTHSGSGSFTYSIGYQLIL